MINLAKKKRGSNNSSREGENKQTSGTSFKNAKSPKGKNMQKNPYLHHNF